MKKDTGFWICFWMAMIFLQLVILAHPKQKEKLPTDSFYCGTDNDLGIKCCTDQYARTYCSYKNQ